MLSSPYPIPPSRWHTVILVTGWLVGALVAPWILTFPPVSYEGLGLVASYGWGVMFGVGGLLVAVSHAREDYRTEIPGLGLVIGGLVIYLMLSWGQVAGGTTGSGSRALLLVPFTAMLLARLLRLSGHHRSVQRLQRVARRPDGTGTD